MKPERSSRYETAHDVRERLDYENDLLAQRTTWILASQAFLLSAYAICVVGTNTERLNPHAATLELLVALLPWTAIVSLVSLYVTVAAGLITMGKLRRAHKPSDPWEELLIAGPLILRMSGLVAPATVPAIFLITWSAVLWVR
jgi:hypothetical protein